VPALAFVSFRARLDNSAPTSRTPECSRRERTRIFFFPSLPVSFRAQRRIPDPSSPLPVWERIKEPALSLPKGEGPIPRAIHFARDLQFCSPFLSLCHSERPRITPLPPAEALSIAEGKESRISFFPRHLRVIII
jgi:hypothetical protein